MGAYRCGLAGRVNSDVLRIELEPKSHIPWSLHHLGNKLSEHLYELGTVSFKLLLYDSQDAIFIE